jgi:hypothetical protein
VVEESGRPRESHKLKIASSNLAYATIINKLKLIKMEAKTIKKYGKYLYGVDRFSDPSGEAAIWEYDNKRYWIKGDVVKEIMTEPV